MKYFCVGLLFMLLACNAGTNTSKVEIYPDSVLVKKSQTYKPGLGEFMSGIQVHHAKLWFAGVNQNWKLADFEIHEIGEALDDIRTFNIDRVEVKSINMIDAPIDSVSFSIQQHDLNSFKKNFILLTNTCNSCHKATDHGFNVVKVPDTPPFSNQDFKVQ